MSIVARAVFIPHPLDPYGIPFACLRSKTSWSSWTSSVMIDPPTSYSSTNNKSGRLSRTAPPEIKGDGIWSKCDVSFLYSASRWSASVGRRHWWRPNAMNGLPLRGTSLVIVRHRASGFSKGRPLTRISWHECGWRPGSGIFVCRNFPSFYKICSSG